MTFAVAAITTVAVAGQLYSSNKASKEQQKAANIQNARERRQQLAAMRAASRALEFQGAVSGTGGGSAQAQATGSTVSTGAAKIGAQMQTIASANNISHWNRMESGFGALGKLAGVMSDPGMYVGQQKGKG